jgi:methionyl-tRNA formyltransferase
VRVVFFGSPHFAAPSLEALAAAKHDVALVVTQPAKPVGRKALLTDPVVAAKAKALGVPVFQPPTLKDDSAVARLAEAQADVFVVVAYGKILPQRVLDLPRLGCVNVHGSLLPRWRGASPVQAAILAGDAETGVSIMKMDAGMDTGPVYSMQRTKIEEEETAEELGARIAGMGADALVDTLVFLEGELVSASRDAREAAGRGGSTRFPSQPVSAISVPPIPQDSSCVTYCPKISRGDGRVDWSRPADDLVRRSRAFTPWPGIFTIRRKSRLKLSGLSVAASGPWTREGAKSPGGVSPGALLEAGPRVVVACGEATAVSIGVLQAEGRKALSAPEFVRGEHVSLGEVWGE